MPERYDEHYVQSVVRMGDSRNVYTNQAIFTTNKIKLVEKGVKVDSALYEGVSEFLCKRGLGYS